MKTTLEYMYYRITRFYRKIFGIEEAPGYLLILSCYDWGLLILSLSLLCYLLVIETFILSFFGIKMNVWYVIITDIPFAIAYLFSDEILKNDKNHFDLLDQKYKEEKLKHIKGILVVLFVLLSLPSFLVALHFF